MRERMAGPMRLTRRSRGLILCRVSWASTAQTRTGCFLCLRMGFPYNPLKTKKGALFIPRLLPGLVKNPPKIRQNRPSIALIRKFFILSFLLFVYFVIIIVISIYIYILIFLFFFFWGGGRVLNQLVGLGLRIWGLDMANSPTGC